MKTMILSWGHLFPVVIMLAFGTACDNKDKVIPEESIKDADGNEYTSVTIGDQEWMVENLKVTSLNDGTPVPEVQDDTLWSDLQNEGLCWYDNNESGNKNVYGALYNWHTVATGKLCPSGWHVPTANEWEDLYDYLGDSAASKLKEIGNGHWSSSNKDATNSTGFTALPGGYRIPGTGFKDQEVYGYWWTSSLDLFDNSRGLAREMNQFSRDGSQLVFSKTYGLSVRCMKD